MLVTICGCSGACSMSIITKSLSDCAAIWTVVIFGIANTVPSRGPYLDLVASTNVEVKFVGAAMSSYCVEQFSELQTVDSHRHFDTRAWYWYVKGNVNSHACYAEMIAGAPLQQMRGHICLQTSSQITHMPTSHFVDDKD